MHGQLGFHHRKFSIVDTLGKGANDLVEYPNDNRSVTLQFLNDLHPREQLILGLAKISDLGDLPVEIINMALQKLIATGLLLHRAIEHQAATENQHQANYKNSAEIRQKIFLPTLALPFAPGK
jgi:hypothetical protein